MADILVSQGDVGVVADTSPDIQMSQADVLAIYRLPAKNVQASQADVSVIVRPDTRTVVSQFDIIAIVKGQVFDPAVRAWTFSLDGHDFYVLRLGNTETLVFDLTTEQWYVWGTAEANLWSAFTGINWFGGNNFASVFGSNVLVGSDSNGAIFFLDPNNDLDSSAANGRDAVPFRRRITAQIPVRGYDNFSIYEVQLIGSTGNLTDETLTSMSLLYSDDRGETYVDAGTVDINQNDFEGRATWRSLGSFRSPGRLLRVEDFGSLRRIDSFTMNSDFGD